MMSLLALAAVYALLLAILLMIGIGLGFLLSWMLPDLSFETSVLIAVVSVNATLYFFLKLLTQAEKAIDNVEGSDTKGNRPIFVLPDFPLHTPRQPRKKRR